MRDNRTVLTHLTSASVVRRTACLLLACVCSLVGPGLLAQTTPSAQVTLTISVKWPGTDGALLPVSRYALLISPNPTTAAPRRVLTGPDGTVVVRLRPGNYTVESDEPLSLNGRGYSWTQTLDVPPGVDTALSLTDSNAEVGTVTDAATGTGARVGADPTLVLPRWKDSVVRLWTPSTHATGFVVDAAGLVVTSQRAVGDATAVEVQFGDTKKVAGVVVGSDRARDVAFVRVNEAAIASAAVPLPCGAPPVLTEGAIVATLGAPLGEPTALMTGDVVTVRAQSITADLALVPGSAGGPVFTAEGVLAGVTSIDEQAERRRTRIVPVGSLCAAHQAAQLLATPPPSAAALPVESAQPYPLAALQAMVAKRAGSLSPYRFSTSGFDVSLITPPMVWAARQPDRRTTSADTHITADQSRLPAWSDFGPWADYLAARPAVIVVRVTPKLTESFWGRMARGAAMTQGMNLPAFKRVDASFARLVASCGGREVMPIHPFTLESSIGGDTALVEGLYVFPANAFPADCGAATLTVYSQKEPQKGDVKAIDPAMLRQVLDDLQPALQP